MTEEEEKEAFARQQAHREISDKAGMVEVYLDTPLPEKWNNWSIEQRQTQFDSASDVSAEKERSGAIASALRRSGQVLQGSPGQNAAPRR